LKKSRGLRIGRRDYLLPRVAIVVTLAGGLACNSDGPLPAPSAADARLVVGVDGHHGRWPRAELRHRARLGAPVTRHEWDPAQPVASEDRLVRDAARRVRTRIHPLLGGNDLGDPERYARFVVAFIRRYGRGGSFWRAHPELDERRYAMTTFELGNEPYLGEMSASEYADAVRPALEAVSRLDVPARLILPAATSSEGAAWVGTLYARIPDLNRLFGGFALHPYDFGRNPAAEDGSFEQIEDLRREMDWHGANDKPILITEYGQSTARCGAECVSEAAQARHLRAFLDTVARRPRWKVRMVSVYQLSDRGTRSPEREFQFGLLRQNGSPKPSYPVVRERMRRYR
jgi:hypothetical protein